MAKIVMGAGTPKTPQVSLPGELWPRMGENDHKQLGARFDDLRRVNEARVVQALSPAGLQRSYDACQVGLDGIAASIAKMSPDVLIIFGDEDRSLAQDQNMPPLSVFCGPHAEVIPPPASSMRVDLAPAMSTWYGDKPESYPVAKELSEHVIRALMARNFDVACCQGQQPGVSINSSFSFVVRRLVQPASIPIVPIVINAQFPPNQPSLQRCYDFGQAVRSAVETWASDQRIGVIASGGLSHILLDEELDRQVIDALLTRKVEALFSLPGARLDPGLGDSGTGEVRCWLAAAGALQGLTMTLIDYVPGYRSPAATGCGMTFATWA